MPVEELPPIHHLPPELLSLIFEYICPCPENKWSTEGAWTLGGVCQAWRTVVQSNPMWWASLNFKGEPLNGLSEERANLVRQQLALSQHQPLRLDFEEDTNTSQSNSDLIMSCGTVIHPHLDRLSSATVATYYYRFPLLFAPESHDPPPILPSLETLHLTFKTGPHYSSSKPGLDFDHATAPQLRQVHLVDFYGADQVNLPWSQLTAVMLHNCGLDKAWSCLRLLDNSILNQLEIGIRAEELLGEVVSFENPIPDARTFSRVETLMFGFTASFASEDDTFYTTRQYFLTALHFPCLSSLTLKGIRCNDQLPLAPPDFIHAISRNLTRIHFQDVYLISTTDNRTSADTPKRMVYRALHQLSNLEHISVNGKRAQKQPISDVIVALLASSEHLCPKLRSLDVDSAMISFKTFSDLVSLRVSPIIVPITDRAPLRSVIFRDSAFVDADEESSSWRELIAAHNDFATRLLMEKCHIGQS